MYELKFSNKALKSLKGIVKKDAIAIVENIENLAKNPFDNPNVKKLNNHAEAIYRPRVGNYQVLFDREDKLRIIDIIEIGHRKDIYK
jgi:mRNA interferase RelE/StbE